MLETYIEFCFDAAFTTPEFPRPNGRSFSARVTYVGEPDPVYGWSHDFRDVEPVVEDVRLALDHKMLNDVPGLELPTEENIRSWIWDRLDGRIEGLKTVELRGRGVPDDGCLEFEFEVAHTTPQFDWPHGHTFKARVARKGGNVPVAAVEQVRAELNHRYMNDIPGLSMPTLENVCRWVWHRLSGIVPDLETVELRRGAEGHAEGCRYDGRGKAFPFAVAA